MATQLGGLAGFGDVNQSSNSTNPPLNQNTPLRNFVHSPQRRLTIAFAREENIEVPEIPDTVRSAVQHREVEDQPTTNVKLTTRQISM